jgi:4-hydroxyphenylpyruvate dioxygenase-like putative hemolysin
MNLRQACIELENAMEYADLHPTSPKALAWVDDAQDAIDKIIARKEKAKPMMKPDDTIILEAMKRKAKK